MAIPLTGCAPMGVESVISDVVANAQSTNKVTEYSEHLNQFRLKKHIAEIITWFI